MEESNKNSFKQKVIDSRGKEVPMDYFLYSCLEHERTAQATRSEADEDFGWPALISHIANPNGDPEFKTMPLAALLTRMTAWYRDTFPALTEISVIDYESLLEIVDPLVNLNRDISLLYKVRTEEDLPDFEGSVGNNKYWDDIISTISEYFRNSGHLYIRYIQWSHAAVTESDNINVGDRPPVGRYAPRYNTPFQSGPRGGGNSGGGRPDRGNERSGGRDGNNRNAPSGGGRPDRGPRPDRGNDRGGPRASNDNQRGGQNRPQRDGGGPRDGGGRKHRDDVDSQLLDSAMAEVDQAIESLRTNESMDEVLLKPQNSFYRRIQHQKIVDMGYHSFSVGEGPDRSVRVARRS